MFITEWIQIFSTWFCMEKIVQDYFSFSTDQPMYGTRYGTVKGAFYHLTSEPRHLFCDHRVKIKKTTFSVHK